MCWAAAAAAGCRENAGLQLCQQACEAGADARACLLLVARLLPQERMQQQLCLCNLQDKQVMSGVRQAQTPNTISTSTT